jgi:MFS family permease
MSAYRAVLTIPGSPRLFASALFARLPQGMASLAILLLVRGATHSYAAAGAAVGAYSLASAALAPVQGRLVDRLGRTRILAPSAIGQGVLLGVLVIAAREHVGVAFLVVLSGAAGALMPPIAPTVRALLREVVPDQSVRDTAYALESVAQETIWITGPLLVALIITASSPSGAVLALGVVCICGTLLFVSSPLARDRPIDGQQEARKTALASPKLRALLAPVALSGMGLGAIEVGLPSLALHAGSRWATGLLLALWSLGSMVGGLWYGARLWSSPLERRYREALLVLVAFSAPLILARSVPAGIVCSVLAGLAIAPTFSCQYALVGRAVSTGSETEAFTWMTAALVGGVSAGSAAGGGVIQVGGVGAPFALSCAATGLAALLALRRI